MDRKVKFTPEVVGAAAAFESWKAFERDPAHKPSASGKLAHARSKQVRPFCILRSSSADDQIVADLAASMAVRLIDEKRLPFTSTSNEEKFKLDAQRFARADAKRALRESGYYKTHELGPIEDDERAAPRKI